MHKLYVENKLIDITEETINLVLQLNDIGNIKTRNSSYSRSIKIPLTINNRHIFNYLGVKGNTSRKPYKKLKCDYFVNNIQIIKDGYLVISEIKNNFIRASIHEGIIDLSNRIEGKTLKDLNFDDVNHYLNLQTFKEYLSNKTGFIYGLADFGKGFSNIIQVESQAPSLYLHTIFDKIFKEAGLNYTGDFFNENNEDFYSEVITVSKGYTLENIIGDEDVLGTIQTNNVAKNDNSDDFISYEEKHTLTGSATDINIVNNELKFNFNGNVNLNIKTTFNKYDTYLLMRIEKNGVPVNFITIDNDTNEIITNLNTLVKTGDKISFHIAVSSYNSQNNDFNSISFSTKSTIKISTITGGNFIDFKEIVEDVSQKDIISDVMQRYGLMIRKGSKPNSYEFIQIEKLLSDKENAVDYSKYFIEEEKQDFQTNYAILNKASYNYTDDVVDFKQDGSFEIDNETLKAEKTLFTSPYEIAKIKKYSNNYLIPIWSRLEDNQGFENEETKIKIFRVQNTNRELSMRYFDSTINDYSGVASILTLQNISMQYFLNNNYKSFKALLNNYKEITFTLNLNNIQINQFDFYKLIYIKNYGKYFYVNSLNYGRGMPKVKAVQIDQFLKNSPPTKLTNYEFDMNYKSTRTISKKNLLKGYQDPEFDKPLKIKILSFGNNRIKIRQNGNIIDSETVINWSDLNLTIKDIGLFTSKYSKSFEYQIADEGSEKFGNVKGYIKANVKSYNNNPPVANAGNDYVFEINTQLAIPNTFIILDGGQSYDDTGEIIKYEWEVISKPANSNPQVQNLQIQTPYASLILPNNNNSLGNYKIKLTVTDEFGASDTDNIKVTVKEGNNDGGFEPGSYMF